ncbi:uroporphyrinogen-III C-methyltransferase [Ideonella sp. 4Y16]|uniref:uroporphyrinogen-III C-methyltransferase n=1 Tax=Ideonella alba TaxID=2824118 RepID=A0A940Y8X0_9BURK|nr:uroporphyrinogen-III C-methyltransferase [Ideonella alba]MBQ0930816.1 uroporphyrinogen-III C-methyltransferase [Ideonella alba]MBQ0944931.1 uroporphyrinogen-III C-methyltransferase [Ideonella alba]
MTGHVLFIGAGPGAADLITRRGWTLLGTATVVLADALADPALREAAPAARWIDVGKRGFSHATAQHEINRLLVELAGAGERVARLKGGDPSVFGRLEEEIEALQAAGLGYEVVPGVSAAQAAAAATARPLTRRGEGRSVAFSTAMTAQHELRVERRADTEIFYMAGQQLAALGERLQAAGWPADAPACVVSRAGWPDQRVSDHQVGTLGQAHALHAGRPAVVLVGVGSTPLSAGHTAAIAGYHSDPPATL